MVSMKVYSIQKYLSNCHCLRVIEEEGNYLSFKLILGNDIKDFTCLNKVLLEWSSKELSSCSFKEMLCY